ncbi:MAG: hypothetical protein ACD_3C00188G0025 [uncultured bacterium (gcode 4)]|uniref:Uncharacterized protein n=1 Tax=uncultured bacterium (gcode 4) TaxID=1234023 RepID=K2GBP9_9BACT|nr:MAG: hypothetical protein ACD_3C00188G0025 [uncultured bacterium (gcode 4)]
MRKLLTSTFLGSWKSPQNPLVETKDFKYDIRTDSFTEKNNDYLK